MRCTNCKKDYDNELSFCPNCGQKSPSDVSTASVTCQHCGQTLPAETNFCTNCGKRIANLSSSSSSFQARNYFASPSSMIIHIIFAAFAFIAAFYYYTMRNEIPYYLKDQKQSLLVCIILYALLGLEECYEAYLTQQVHLFLRADKIEYGYMVAFPFPSIRYESVDYEDVHNTSITGVSTLVIHSFGTKRRLPIKNAKEAKMYIDKQRP